MSKKDHHQIPLRLPVELYESVEAQARERGMTTSAYIREVLTDATHGNVGQEKLLKSLHKIGEETERQIGVALQLFETQILIAKYLFRNVGVRSSFNNDQSAEKQFESFLTQLTAHLPTATWFSRVLENAYEDGKKSRERGRE